MSIKAQKKFSIFLNNRYHCTVCYLVKTLQVLTKQDRKIIFVKNYRLKLFFFFNFPDYFKNTKNFKFSKNSLQVLTRFNILSETTFKFQDKTIYYILFKWKISLTICPSKNM